ncbi:MAG: HAMP domain-containing histidine kinase [Clostridiales bacterium]|nr:HAMP domain-containing histidine kinase [Clostridiales bacterium]
MISKLSLPRQIALVFTLAYVPAVLMIGIFIVGNLRAVYRDALYDSLEAEGNSVWKQVNPDAYETAENMASIRYASRRGTYKSSGNLDQYISDDSVPLLIGKALTQEAPEGRYVNRIEGNIIYYVVLNRRGYFSIREHDVVIVLTDMTALRRMVRAASVRLFWACLAALALGACILYLWARLLARDIRGIRDSVAAMGVDHYRTRLRTARSDELGDLTRSIEVMRERIIEHERSRQTVIQGVSHDLKTPIGVISSYAIAIKDGMCDPIEAADVTLRQTRRLTDKVTKLLHLTRLGYLNIERIKAESVPMNRLISELIPGYSLQTQAAIESETQEVHFRGDEESWRIVLENIMDNAVRYAASRIVITLSQGALTIWNDGKPIPEQEIPNLFRAYEKSREGKFGLGLSIVRQTAELFGYTASAENADGGVRFTIREAAADDAPSAQ